MSRDLERVDVGYGPGWLRTPSSSQPPDKSRRQNALSSHNRLRPSPRNLQRVLTTAVVLSRTRQVNTYTPILLLVMAWSRASTGEMPGALVPPIPQQGERMEGAY